MADCIDRAQIIRLIDRIRKQKGLSLSTNERKFRNATLNDIQRLVRSIPQSIPDSTKIVTVHDKEYKGTWISRDGAVECSECKNRMLGCQRYSFCPNCGAKMGIYIECG